MSVRLLNLCSAYKEGPFHVCSGLVRGRIQDAPWWEVDRRLSIFTERRTDPNTIGILKKNS
jgi:hypothetical protein